MATATPVSRAVTVPTQPYLLSFHTCALGASDCSNPANHIVQLAQSADGVSWSLVGEGSRIEGRCQMCSAVATCCMSFRRVVC